MYQLDFNTPKHIFFCGIGGISMSGLSEILIDKGFKVSGSDMKESALTDNLSKKGIKIHIGQSAENITSDIDVFVYTAAVKNGHPELTRASELNMPMLTRAELLGQIMKNYSFPVAISGTHGKTTVTSMVSEILLKSGQDPTLSIGGILKSIGGNIKIGSSDIFVTEACEYTNSFLSFYPKVSVILNVEEDHLDFFKDINDIRSSFNKFARLTPDDGVVIIGNDIEKKESVLDGVSCNIITFGKDSAADYYPDDVETDDKGITHFIIKTSNDKYNDDKFTLMVPGFHNVLNALAAVAVADYLSISRTDTKRALAEFGGTDRRFEHKGEINGITVIDDYAHHPSEIRATINAALSCPHKKLWVVFQPHTYSRTKAFMDEFAEALSLSDAVIMTDIYAARETDNLGISSKDVADRLNKLNTECYYIQSFDDIKKFILKNCAPGDMLITMGAGDVVKIGDELLKL